MEKQFKLFDLSDGSQVMVEKTFDNEDDDAPFKMQIVTYYEGVRAQFGACYTDEEQLNEQFEKYDIDSAETIRKSVIASLTSED